MVKYLSGSPVDIQIDLLKTIISGKNVNYIERVSNIEFVLIFSSDIEYLIIRLLLVLTNFTKY
jgi:hypothetical protein